MPPTPKSLNSVTKATKELGTFKEDNTFTVVKEYNTPAGKKYYSASSPDLSTANRIADYKNNTVASDSIPSNLIIKKIGGTINGSKLRRQASSTGLRTSKKHK